MWFIKTSSHSKNVSSRALKLFVSACKLYQLQIQVPGRSSDWFCAPNALKIDLKSAAMPLKEQMAGKWYTGHLLARHMATTRSMMDLVCTRAWTWVPNCVTKFTRLPVTSAIFDPSKNSPPHPKNYFVRLLRVALVKCLRPHLIWNLVDCDVFPHLREIWRFLRIWWNDNRLFKPLVSCWFSQYNSKGTCERNIFLLYLIGID